jgi:beta-glucosidase
MFAKTTLVFSSALFLCASAFAATPTDPDSRADALIKQMTQSEKLQLVFGYFATDFSSKNYKRIDNGMPDAAGYIPGIDHLHIPAQSQTDAGIGVATQRSPTPRERTALPSGLATAATWNPELAFAGGAMIGDEARRSGFNVQLAGGVNLMREPRNGRNFEYGGEDPLLAGIMDGNAIKGIQSAHVVSTMKHYAFNDQETSRTKIDVKIDEASAASTALMLARMTGCSIRC